MSPEPGSSGPNGNTLTITFAANSFGVGDFFRFGFDTDGLGTAPGSGEDFGDFSVPVTVELESGDTGAASFFVTQVNEGPGGPIPQSIAQVDTGARSVPEPGSALLLGLGVLGAGLIRRKRRS